MNYILIKYIPEVYKLKRTLIYLKEYFTINIKNMRQIMIFFK